MEKTNKNNVSSKKLSVTEFQSHTRMKTVNIKYTWEIINYSFFCKENGVAITSPLFSPKTNEDLKWQIKIYPDGVKEETKNFMSVFLHLASSSIPKIVAYLVVSIINTKNQKFNTRYAKEQLVLNEKSDLCIRYFIGKDVLERKSYELLPNDTLTLECEITAGIESDTYQNNLKNYRINANHNISVDFEHLLESKKFTDITLIAEDQEIQVHKIILSTRSPVFEAMFQHDMTEKKQNKVKIDDVKYKVLKELLRYIYSGKIQNISDIAEDLLIVAEKYEIKGLKNRCEVTLCKSLAVNNAIRLVDLADLHRADNLKEEAINFINAHAADLLHTSEFKSLVDFKPDLVSEIFFNEKIELR